jgi:hypothetical protein
VIDAALGIIERGRWKVADAVNEQPWLPNGPIPLRVEWTAEPVPAAPPAAPATGSGNGSGNGAANGAGQGRRVDPAGADAGMETTV